MTSSSPRSLLDISLLSPSKPSSSSTSFDPRIVPAIVSFNKACVLDRRRQREASTRKTIVCRAYEETGRCNYGRRCKFAHGLNELRKTETEPSKNKEESTIRFRTMPCLKYSLLGSCPYEDKCTYLHGPSLDIEKCISDLLENEDMESTSSGSSSINSLYSSSSTNQYDPFFTPNDAKSNSFEIRPFNQFI